MADDLSQKKDEALRLLGKVGPEAKKVEDLANQVTQYARFASDVAGPASEILQQVPPESLTSEQWDSQIGGLRAWHSSVQSLQGAVTNINSFVALSQSVSNTAVSGVMVVWSHFPATSPPPPVVEKARTTLFQTLERFPLIDKAAASLRRLGLDVRSGKNSSATLLEEARSALERPVYQDGGAVGVLICLRECIDASVTEMVRRRPKQEPITGGWKGKVASIGRQCTRPGLPNDHFDQVGQEIDKVMNDLSGTKQAAMPRSQLLEQFNRGLLALNALLDSIDESLLR
jgi:hypothetical protein